MKSINYKSNNNNLFTKGKFRKLYDNFKELTVY